MKLSSLFKIKIIYIGLITLSSFSASSKEGTNLGGGGGYSCEIEPGKRALLDLVNDNKDFSDDYEVVKTMNLNLDDRIPSAFYLVNNAFFKKLNPIIESFESALKLIQKESSAHIALLMRTSFAKLYKEMRLIDQNVYAAKDFSLRNKGICQNPEPIAYFSSGFGLSINIRVWNQLGFKSRLGFFLHEIFRHMESSLKGFVNLNTEQIQTLVAEILDPVNAQSRVKNSNLWNNSRIFIGKYDEDKLLKKALETSSKTCLVNNSHINDALKESYSTNSNCNSKILSYIESLKIFYRDLNLYCKMSSKEHLSNLKFTANLENDFIIGNAIYFTPLDSFYNIDHSLLNENQRYEKYTIGVKESCKDELSEVNQKLNQHWNYLSNYFNEYENESNKFNDLIKNKIGLLENYHNKVSTDDRIFLAIEKLIMLQKMKTGGYTEVSINAFDALIYMPIISAYYHVNNFEFINSNKQDVHSGLEDLVLKFTDSIKNDLENYNQSYPGVKSKDLAKKIFDSIPWGEGGKNLSELQKVEEIEKLNLLRQYGYFDNNYNININNVINNMLQTEEVKRKAKEFLNSRKGDQKNSSRK